MAPVPGGGELLSFALTKRAVGARLTQGLHGGVHVFCYHKSRCVVACLTDRQTDNSEL